MTENAYQKVTVRTPGAKDAMCELVSNNTKFVAYPPQTIQVSRVYDDLKVTCFAPGGREKTIVVTPKASPSVLFNVTNGILPGLAIDHESGAMYRLPDVIEVDFSTVNLVAEPLPSYENGDTFPVLTRGLDSEKPGFPGLDSDSPYPPVLQKIGQDVGTAPPSVPVGAVEREPVLTGVDKELPAPPATTTESLTRQYNPGIFVGPGRNEEK